ncbi:hypothetical protein BH09BAC4_BH09BAC4_11730 [soil metagenome]
MNKDYFLALADYNLWVSRIAISWLNQLTDDQWNQVITSSFDSVKQTALHLVSAEKIWLDYWQQVPNPAFLTTQFEGTKEDLIQIWLQTSAALKQFIEGYPPEAYQQSVFFSWRGVNWQMAFWQTFAHFINHATYHRGQLVTLLRQVGFTKLSSTDLATYFRVHQSVETLISPGL